MRWLGGVAKLELQREIFGLRCHRHVRTMSYRIVPAECLDVPQPDRLLGFLQGLRLTYSQGIREKQDGG